MTTPNSTINLSRRAFVGAAALGAAALAAGGLETVAPKQAFAAEDAGETYVYTSCPMCNQSVFCGLKGTVKDGKLVRVEGNDQHSKPKPCLKGLTSLQNVYDPNRLLYPLKRTNPKKGLGEDPQWERIGWDEALSTIAAEFNKAKEAYGAPSVTFHSGDPKEHLPVFCRVAALFGTPNVSWGGAQCAFAEMLAGILDFGGRTGSLPNADTKVHLQWGSNIAWSMYPQPTAYKGMLDAKKAGCKYIVIDTRLTPTAVQLADIYLQPRPGSEGALALAMGNVITFSGPMLAGNFGAETLDPFTEHHFWQALRQPEFTLEWPGEGPNCRVEGTLWGGNLAMLTSLIGTRRHPGGGGYQRAPVPRRAHAASAVAQRRAGGAESGDLRQLHRQRAERL